LRAEQEAREEQARAKAKEEAAVKRQAELEAGEKAREEARERHQAKIEAKQQRRAEVQEKRDEKKINRWLGKSEKYLLKDDYNSARRYVDKTQKVDPENIKAWDALGNIDQAEMLEQEEKIVAERPKKLEQAERKTKKQDKDILKKHDEPKRWYDYISNIFVRKKYELGEIQDDRLYTINECVQLGLSRNLRYKVANEQVKLAEMRVWEARRDLLPTATAKMERSYGKVGASGRSRHYRGEKYQFEVKHVLFDGMGTWFALRQAQANTKIVKRERDKVKADITKDVKKAYYSLDRSIKALDIQSEFKTQINKYYDIASKAIEENIIPKMAFLRAKASSMEADFRHYSAEEDVKIGEMILFQAMNMDPDQHIFIKPVRSPENMLSIGLENCYQLAKANRPDLRIKATMIEYYNFERKMMKAKGWPKIDFQGSFGKAFEAYQPLDQESDYEGESPGGGAAMSGRTLSPEWYAGIRGNFPIWGSTFEYNYVREHWSPTVSAFRGTETATSYLTWKILDDLAYFSNLQEAKIGFDRAKYEYNKELQDTLLQVKENYFTYRKTLINMDVSRARLEHQDTYVKVMEERMRLGEVQFTDFMDELVKLAEYIYGVLQTDSDYFISLTELNRVIGVPGYFKADYESQDFEEWEKERNERIAAEEKALKDKEIAGLLKRARMYLEKGKYGHAKELADMAFAVDPSSKTVDVLSKEIDEAWGASEKVEREKEAARLAKEMEEREAKAEARLAREKDQARKRAEQEAHKKERAKKIAAEREAREKARETELAAKKKAKEEAAAKREAEQEARKQQIAQERVARQRVEQAAREKAKQDAAAKRKAEQQARKQQIAQEQAARDRAKQDAAAKRQAERDAKIKAREVEKEQARKRAEQEARKKERAKAAREK
ncbi:MAG: TolC family protein, partial [Candidatus Omnitrophota bacterium]